MDSLPATERRVARALLGHYPAAGLEPAVKLAERAGASAPTVTRYVARLGFSDYREFQQALRDEMDARRMGPMHTPPQFIAGTATSKVLADSSRQISLLLKNGFNAIAPSEFAKSVQLLADPRRRVFGVGGRFSNVIARFLELHLRMLRPNTGVIEMSVENAAAPLLDLGKRDVLVVFDFRRYQRSAVEFCARARERRSTIILITDLWFSPIAEFADVVMPLQTDNGSPFDTLVPAAALVETLAAAVLAELGDSAYERMRMLDEYLGEIAAP